MPLKRDQKEKVVEKVGEIVKNNPSVVFVNFHGLPVSAANEIRDGLKEQELGYYVAKKTLAKIAFSNADLAGERPSLDGELALVYGQDAIAPAREIKNFQKKYKESLAIMGGIFDGEFVSRERMEEIASIPSPQALYGQFVGLINSPIQRFVASLDQISKKKEQ